MYSQKYDTQVFIADAPRRDPLSRGKIIMIISAAAVLVMTTGLSFFAIEKIFSLKYGQAVALMDSNNFLKAKEEFLSFSGYRDSAARAQECRDSMDFDSAEALLESGDYVSARKIFIALEDFGEAPEKVLECDYKAATELLSAGNTQEAKDAFLVLGDFSDSEERARLCQNEIDYNEAADLLSQEDYTAALDIFESLKGYKDSQSKAVECNNHLDYAKAEKAFSEGNFYTAYLSYIKLGNFSDSAERAAACVQKNPASGQIYRNPNYSKKTCPLTIKAPKDGYSTFIKIYHSGTLVSSVFIASGKKVTVNLPAGTYELREAAGKTWFGQNEAFGDEDAYYGASGELKLKKGYICTLSLRVKKGNMDSTEIERSDF